MPSIFEKPSLLGFRAEGGAVDTPYTRASRAWTSPIGSVRPGTLTINPLDSVPTEGGLPQWLARNIPAGVAGLQDFVENAILSPAIYAVSGYDTGESAQKEKILREMGYGVPEATPAAVQASTPAPTPAPATTPSSIFGPPAPGNQIFGPHAFLANQQLATAAPAGSRAANVQAAMDSGEFGAKQKQYNDEAMRMGHPSMMDDQGNIVGRELSEPERMREFFKTTGGNTMFSQTNDPAQRALQNEMMKQARGQAAANTFGFNKDERFANLQQETEARKILATPLGNDVREVAPGIRGAFKDGQTVGFATNQAPPKGPNGESTATMNDPLGKYMTVTGADGQERVVLNPNPPQIQLADEMKDTGVRQGIEGKTGGSPLERGLIAAMAAEEARKKKLADDAAAAALAATPPTNEAELIARTPAVTIAPREAAAPKPPPPTRFTPLKDIPGSAVMWDVDPDTGKKLSKPQKMIW